MSLGSFTKCDLSDGVAKIDLSALGNVLQTAYFKAMVELGKECRVPNFADPEKYTESLLEMIAYRHRSMELLMLHMGQLAELAHTVNQCNGKKIKIVNYPLWIKKNE